MSIVLLQEFQINIEKKLIEIDEEYDWIIVFSGTSIFLFFIYCILYKRIIYFHRNPNPLIFYKILSSALLTIHFIILFLFLRYPNHLQVTVLNYSAIASIPILFSCYFYSCCIAHNIHETFYSYNKSFNKRKRQYLLYGLISISIITYLSFCFHIEQSFDNIEETGIHFTIKMFNRKFALCFYFLCLLMLVFMCKKIINVLIDINDVNEQYMIINKHDERAKLIKKLVASFVKRHALFILSFVIANLPNNLAAIFLIVFNKGHINIINFRKWNTVIMSLNLLTSLVITMFDPCISKYLKYMSLHYLTGKDITKMIRKINDGGKYSNIYNVNFPGEEMRLLNKLDIRNIKNYMNNDFDEKLNNIDYYTSKNNKYKYFSSLSYKTNKTYNGYNDEDYAMKNYNNINNNGTFSSFSNNHYNRSILLFNKNSSNTNYISENEGNINNVNKKYIIESNNNAFNGFNGKLAHRSISDNYLIAPLLERDDECFGKHNNLAYELSDNYYNDNNNCNKRISCNIGENNNTTCDNYNNNRKTSNNKKDKESANYFNNEKDNTNKNKNKEDIESPHLKTLVNKVYKINKEKILDRSNNSKNAVSRKLTNSNNLSNDTNESKLNNYIKSESYINNTTNFKDDCNINANNSNDAIFIKRFIRKKSFSYSYKSSSSNKLDITEKQDNNSLTKEILIGPYNTNTYNAPITLKKLTNNRNSNYSFKDIYSDNASIKHMKDIPQDRNIKYDKDDIIQSSTNNIKYNETNKENSINDINKLSNRPMKMANISKRIQMLMENQNQYSNTNIDKTHSDTAIHSSSKLVNHKTINNNIKIHSKNNTCSLFKDLKNNSNFDDYFANSSPNNLPQTTNLKLNSNNISNNIRNYISYNRNKNRKISKLRQINNNNNDGNFKDNSKMSNLNNYHSRRNNNDIILSNLSKHFNYNRNKSTPKNNINSNNNNNNNNNNSNNGSNSNNTNNRLSYSLKNHLQTNNLSKIKDTNNCILRNTNSQDKGILHYNKNYSNDKNTNKDILAYSYINKNYLKNKPSFLDEIKEDNYNVTGNFTYNNENHINSGLHNPNSYNKRNSLTSLDEMQNRSSLSILDNDDFQLMQNQKINSEKIEKIIGISSIIKLEEQKKKEKNKHKHNKHNSSIIGKCSNLKKSDNTNNNTNTNNSDLPSDLVINNSEHYYRLFSADPIEIDLSNNYLPDNFRFSSKGNSYRNSNSTKSYKYNEYNDKIKKMNIRITSYFSTFFDHLKQFRNLGLMYKSFDPSNNIKLYTGKIVSGGRSGIPITLTFDNKYIIKSITTGETEVFKRMVKDFYLRFKNKDTLLCPITGLFKIKANKSPTQFIIVMKNMAEIDNSSCHYENCYNDNYDKSLESINDKENNELNIVNEIGINNYGENNDYNNSAYSFIDDEDNNIGKTNNPTELISFSNTNNNLILEKIIQTNNLNNHINNKINKNNTNTNADIISNSKNHKNTYNEAKKSYNIEEKSKHKKKKSLQSSKIIINNENSIAFNNINTGVNTGTNDNIYIPKLNKLFTFDLKGSTVDRMTLSMEEVSILKEMNSWKNKNNQMSYSYNNTYSSRLHSNNNQVINSIKEGVLKDEDYRLLEIKLKLSDEDSKRFLDAVEKDCTFLNKYNITDYSLLLCIYDLREFFNNTYDTPEFNDEVDQINNEIGSINTNTATKLQEQKPGFIYSNAAFIERYKQYIKEKQLKKEKYINNLKQEYNIFISTDGNYLYQISIIDYLSEYNYQKMGEYVAKSIKMFILGAKDSNFSAQNANTYSKRMIEFSKFLVNCN